MLTEGGMMIALATILSYIKVYEAPMGGSVTAGSMIPIMLFCNSLGYITRINHRWCFMEYYNLY